MKTRNISRTVIIVIIAALLFSSCRSTQFMNGRKLSNDKNPLRTNVDLKTNLEVTTGDVESGQLAVDENENIQKLWADANGDGIVVEKKANAKERKASQKYADINKSEPEIIKMDEKVTKEYNKAQKKEIKSLAKLEKLEHIPSADDYASKALLFSLLALIPIIGWFFGVRALRNSSWATESGEKFSKQNSNRKAKSAKVIGVVGLILTGIYIIALLQYSVVFISLLGLA